MKSKQKQFLIIYAGENTRGFMVEKGRSYREAVNRFHKKITHFSLGKPISLTYQVWDVENYKRYEGIDVLANAEELAKEFYEHIAV